MSELWEWPYVPEMDKHGFARVEIPERLRHGVRKGYRVHLVCPDGGVLKGHVVECNYQYARVEVDGERKREGRA